MQQQQLMKIEVMDLRKPGKTYWEYLKRRKRRGTLYNFIITLKMKEIIKNGK